MATAIRHTGTVEKATKDKITVSLAADDGNCNGCAIASLCSKGEIIELPYTDASSDMVGRKVEIIISIGAQRKALLLMLVVPIVLLIGIIALTMTFGAGEAFAAVTSVAVTALWLGFVYLRRGQLLATDPVKITFI